jgi:HSP20 family protein
MKKPELKQTLIGVGLVALVGAVGAQTYYAHRLSVRLAEQEAKTAGLMIPVDDRAAQIADRGQWDPWGAMHADMMRMQAQMDQVLGGAFGGPPGMAPDPSWPGVGSVTLDEQGNNYVVKAAIPGLKDGDLNVNVDGQVLSITGDTHGQEQQSVDNGQMTSQERYSSTFERAFTLPGPVDSSKMHSQYQDGVLTVTIPKAS